MPTGRAVAMTAMAAGGAAVAFMEYSRQRGADKEEADETKEVMDFVARRLESGRDPRLTPAQAGFYTLVSRAHAALLVRELGNLLSRLERAAPPSSALTSLPLSLIHI